MGAFSADRGFIPRNQVRQVTVNALVDTGAWTLVINEAARQKLGLNVSSRDRDPALSVLTVKSVKNYIEGVTRM
jgi:predicted aspartyl protease